MKTIIIIRFILTVLAITVFMLVLHSCKKMDSNPKISMDNAKAIARIKENVASQMAKEGGIPQVFTRNQPVTTQWIDHAGNPVTKEQMQSNNFTSVCNYNLPSYCNLIQYSRVFQCASSGLGGPGYLLQFEYEVSWNNNIIATNTVGNIEIYEDATSNLVQSISLEDINSEMFITEIGPGSGDNYIFRVKFVTVDYDNDLVPTSYINGDFGTYTIKISAQFGTDCSSGGDPYALWALPVTTYGFTGDSGNDPCKRNEKAWFDYNTGGSYADRFVITGFDAASLSCGYSSPFIRPDLQEVQYSINNGTTWNNFINDITASGQGIDGTAFIRKDDVARSAYIGSGTYNVIIRYRNWKYSGSSSGWPTPSEFNGDCKSVGDIGNGNPTNSTYAYEYFLGVSW